MRDDYVLLIICKAAPDTRCNNSERRRVQANAPSLECDNRSELAIAGEIIDCKRFALAFLSGTAESLQPRTLQWSFLRKIKTPLSRLLKHRAIRINETGN